MANKKLTTKQKIRRYRAVQYTTFVSQFGAIATPYVALGLVNWDKWFAYNPEGYKVGIGGAIALVLVSVATLLVTRAKEDKKKTYGYISIIIGWLMFAYIFKLLATILLEISDIMFITSSGLIGAFGLDQGSNAAKKKKESALKSLESAKQEKEKEQARYELDLEEERKEEKSKKKVRF